jgi:hypothetical protein
MDPLKLLDFVLMLRSKRRRAMSDHALIALIAVVGFTVQIAGLVIIALQLRDSRRTTRAVAGLVYQESERIRALLGDR